MRSSETRRGTLAVLLATATAIAVQPHAVAAPSPQPPTRPIPQATPAPATPAAQPATKPAENSTPPPPAASTPAPSAPSAATPAPEPQVLVAEVQVVGIQGNPAEAELLDALYGAIKTRPGAASTRTQLQADQNAIYGTGLFSNVQVLPEDTPLGVRVTFVVDPNPILTKVETEGATKLPKSVIDDIFADAYGRVVNLQRLQAKLKKINTWYKENSYVLAQVVDASRISPQGVLTLKIAEGIVSDIQVRYLNADGKTVDEEGKPLQGKTRPYIITREFSLKPGDVFSRKQVEGDLKRVFDLGLFSDVRLSLEPDPQDPTKVIVIPNVQESQTGNLSAGVGYSSVSGIFGTIGFQEQNLGGNNQKLSFNGSLGVRQALFDISFTNPWLDGDPNRTSFSASIFSSIEAPLPFINGPITDNLPNGNQILAARYGGQLIWGRPLTDNIYQRSEWSAFWGFQAQAVNIQDFDGNAFNVDQFGNPLTASGGTQDVLTGVPVGITRDTRNDAQAATSGSLYRLGNTFYFPVLNNGVLFNRVTGNFSWYLPAQIVRWTEGCQKANPNAKECPQTFAFNVQGGWASGNVPPYEALCIGGVNTIRGYQECGVASGSAYLFGTAEYRFPFPWISEFVSGAVFLDAGSDLGSAGGVIGTPGLARGKPGAGLGYGIGVRINTPVGPVRLDYAQNTDNGNQLGFAIGQKF